MSFSATLAQNWFNGSGEDKLDAVDTFIDRMWDVYYPALALARVPSAAPAHRRLDHDDGADPHVLTPRILVPDKSRRRVGQPPGA